MIVREGRIPPNPRPRLPRNLPVVPFRIHGTAFHVRDADLWPREPPPASLRRPPRHAARCHCRSDAATAITARAASRGTRPGPDRRDNHTRDDHTREGPYVDIFGQFRLARGRNQRRPRGRGLPRTPWYWSRARHMRFMPSNRDFFHNAGCSALDSSWLDILPTAACSSQYRPTNHRR